MKHLEIKIQRLMLLPKTLFVVNTKEVVWAFIETFISLSDGRFKNRETLSKRLTSMQLRDYLYIYI